tara:strand:+ start:3031 stop:3444 length:414 start_codon:yes stop_codon:yes gene_type:complete
MELKLVLGTKDGKSFQKEVKTDALHGKKLGETVSGNDFGFEGYEFLITGGSDKCGFPMRKGIQEHRKLVLIGAGVGFSGKKRAFGKKKVRKNQKGLLRRRTVCGERITKIIRQVNLKVTKEGKAPLAEAAPEEKQEE